MINEELILKYVDEYLETHQKEIKDIVFKKTETAIKKVINEAFQMNGWHEKDGFAIEAIRGQVKPAIEDAYKDVKLDKEEIIDKVNKEINRQVKKYVREIKVNIG